MRAKEVELMNWGGSMSGFGGKGGLRVVPGCPAESEILDYKESRLSEERRIQVESHIAECDECRELLILSCKIEGAEHELSAETIANQVEKIVRYASVDESRRTAPAAAVTTTARRTGFYVSYPQLAAAALIACAVGLAAVFIITNDRSAESALQDVAQLQRSQGRRTAGWISAFKEHADWEGLRGGQRGGDQRGDSDPAAAAAANTKFELALGKLKSAENDNASAADRLALSQIRLASGSQDGALKALSLLEGLSQRVTNPKTLAEVYNDMGVAQLQVGRTDAAINSFNQALTNQPGMQQALFNRGIALREAGHIAEAKNSFEEFLKNATDENWRAEARSWIDAIGPEIK